MRCTCCNVILTPFESTIRAVSDNNFLDMCEKCLGLTDIKTITREDLREELGTDVANYIETKEDYFE
jgi:hypothetical protein